MTITLDIQPEIQAAIARQAAAQGRAIEDVAAALLESAVNPALARHTAADEPSQHEANTGQALIDAFGDIRGLLTDEEIDRMITRNPSGARPVDLS